MLATPYLSQGLDLANGELEVDFLTACLEATYLLTEDYRSGSAPL